MTFEKAREAVLHVVKSNEFKEFSQSHALGEYPVAVASPVLQQALGASVKTVMFSSEDRNKQVRKDAELGRRRYEIVQIMILDSSVDRLFSSLNRYEC